MAVDLTTVAIQVSDRTSCPGDTSMFVAYKCDLSAPGKVSFPFWLRSPVDQNCVIWGVFTMDRDTAVYLAKEQVWNEALTQFGEQAQPYVPKDMYSGNWDCATAQFALTPWQRAHGGAGEQAVVAPLDDLLFALLLTSSPKMQTAAQLLSQNDATMKAMLKGQPAGELVVPPPVPNYGSVFKGVAAANCQGITPGGGTPGGVPGQTPPGTGYLPTGAEGEKKTAAWVLPAVIVAGLAAGVGIAYAVSRSSKARAAGAAEASEEECRECRY